MGWRAHHIREYPGHCRPRMPRRVPKVTSPLADDQIRWYSSPLGRWQLAYITIRGCALTSWINYMHVAACLYGNKLGQRAPHTRFVVLCHGLFHVICITMPSSCCAIGCTNRWSKVCSVKFYRIPLASDRRSMWVTAIQRKQWTPNDYTRICSDHFCTG